MMDIAARSLSIKRKTITKLLEAGLYPYTKHYLGSFKNHFSTIGLVGMNEACLNARWIKSDLTTQAAQDFTVEVLNHMRSRLSDYQERYGDLYNLETSTTLRPPQLSPLPSVLLNMTVRDIQTSLPLAELVRLLTTPTAHTYQLATPTISSPLLISKTDSRPFTPLAPSSIPSLANVFQTGRAA